MLSLPEHVWCLNPQAMTLCLLLRKALEHQKLKDVVLLPMMHQG